MMKWEKIKEKKKQVWNFPIPSGAIAIAHTHPTIRAEKPSLDDVSTAKKIKLPIYTISYRGIWKVTPDGVVTQTQNYKWRKEIKRIIREKGRSVSKDS
jgi:hypothetical protein